MNPSALNRVCAHPVAVTWALGAAGLDGLIVILFGREVSLATILSDWQASLLLALALVLGAGLGYFAGMFTLWPLVRRTCSRLNGAPFTIGDRVMILCGPLKGNIAAVEDITPGQGGWGVVWLELGPERRLKFSNLFEQYSLLNLGRGESGGAASGSGPGPSQPDPSPWAAGPRG
jgi:hypothetical protein